MSVSVPLLREWAERMVCADSRGAVLVEMMRETGWSRGRCYRGLARVGYESGRKTRSDKMQSGANEIAVEQVAALLAEGVRKSGTRTMHVTTARSILESNGVQAGVSTGTIRRVLRQRKMDLKSLSAETAHVRLKSAYPNYVHQVDPSLCVLYYTPKEEQRVMHVREVHRNKFEQLARKVGNKKLWRYVLVDHYSASVVCRYYEAAGENQHNLWDFLLYAWGKKELCGYVLQGVPQYLMWDAGSANTSRSVSRALGMLGVEAMTHMPGNPRAKGSVETANRIIETQFESRIHSQPARGVAELNKSVAYFCAGWNNNTLAHYDSGLSRGDKRGLQRTGLWLSIRAEQLRVLPDEKLCRGLLTHEPVERMVAGDLSISYKHPRQAQRRLYDVRNVSGIYRGACVRVQPMIMSEDGIVVGVEQLDGTVVRAELRPIVFDEVGFAASAPLVGQEYKAMPSTVVDVAQQAVAMAGRPNGEKVLFGGAMKSRDILEEGSVNVPPVPRGEAITVAVTADECVGSGAMERVVAVAKELKRKYPQWWHDDAYEMLKRKYPQGMSVDDVALEEAQITGLQEQYATTIENIQKLALVGAAALWSAGKDDTPC